MAQRLDSFSQISSVLASGSPVCGDTSLLLAFLRFLTGGLMAAWTATAEKVEGQLALKVSGPVASAGNPPLPKYDVSLVLVKGVTLASATVSAASLADALPLAVTWAKATMDAWKAGLGA
jgi:hypothetical protein